MITCKVYLILTVIKVQPFLWLYFYMFILVSQQATFLGCLFI